MNELIRIEQRNGQDVVDSRLIALEMDVQHASFYRLIKDNQEDIESVFGTIGFKIETSKHTTGASSQKFAFLNEDQATYVMTLCRNTQKVKALKLKLVVSFSKAKKALVEKQPPKNYLEALKALVASEEQKLALQAQIEQDAPLVEYAKRVQYSENSIDFNSFAKMIGTGRTRLFRVMRDIKVIMKDSTLPYQRWIDAGYFEVSQEIVVTGEQASKLVPFALVTPKGQIWLHNKVAKTMNIEDAIAQNIVQGALSQSY